MKNFLILFIFNAFFLTNRGVHGVIGGDTAFEGQFPHLVDIRELRDGPFFHICHGALLNADWVLTTASCCDGIPDRFIKLVLGDFDRNDESSDEVHVGISTHLPHPQYNEFTYENDICLLELEQSVTFTPLIQPAVLPVASTPGQNNFPLAENATITLVGVGSQSSSSTILARFPHYVNLPVVSDALCDQVTGGTPPLYETMVCAGDVVNGGIDGCFGDLGAPMTISLVDNTLAAIYSWNSACAMSSRPSVGTEVTYYVDWIRANTNIV